MDAARPLRSMLDRLAAVRWAPLAADAAGAELLASPASRLAGLAPDPLAALARVTSPPATSVAAVAGTTRPRRSAAAGDGDTLHKLALPGPRPAPPSGPTRPGADGAAPRFRAARPSTPVLPLLTLLPEPQSQMPPSLQALQRPASVAARLGAQPAAVPAQPQVPSPLALLPGAAPAFAEPDEAAALLRRFAAAAGATRLSAQRLRELAHPRRQASQAPPHPGAPAAAPGAVSAQSPQRSSASAAAAGSDAPPRAEAAAGDARPAVQRPQPTLLSDAEPLPRGRGSALADLLRRWPGAAQAPEVAATARSQLAAALPTPDTATPAWPAATQPPLAPARPGDLAAPAQPASDLQFGRTLERVLLAEVRRQGLDVEPE